MSQIKSFSFLFTKTILYALIHLAMWKRFFICCMHEHEM